MEMEDDREERDDEQKLEKWLKMDKKRIRIKQDKRRREGG
jgi:hypothetical protein